MGDSRPLNVELEVAVGGDSGLERDSPIASITLLLRRIEDGLLRLLAADGGSSGCECPQRLWRASFVLRNA